jgi:hypothetical protein
LIAPELLHLFSAPYLLSVAAICETTFTVTYSEPEAMTADGEFRSIRKIPLIPAAKKLYRYKEIDSAYSS